MVYIAIENTLQFGTKYACFNCCSSVIFSITITWWHVTRYLHLNVFTINLPTAGQKIGVHRLSCKLTYDLQPIVKNKPRCAIVKGDHYCGWEVHASPRFSNQLLTIEKNLLAWKFYLLTWKFHLLTWEFHLLTREFHLLTSTFYLLSRKM